ncbi:MAG: SDR family oxidoreductase [Myxococcota bacterium]
MLTDTVEPGRILLTGANGHLGRRTIARIGAGAARPVRAVVRSERAAAVLRALDTGADVEVYVLDYHDEEALTRAADGCDTAVHFVGIILENKHNRFADAHEATCRAMAAAAQRAGLRRIVYLSILGSRPDSPNACLASKGRAEEILLNGSTPAVVLRVPMVIGPGDTVSRQLSNQARSRFVPLLRGGVAVEQPIDAEDVVSAILGALDRPGQEDIALDLAGPESITRRELLERTAALHGNRPTVIPIPRALELFAAAALEAILSAPPLTRAMIGVLDRDDAVETATACGRLGIHLTPLDETLERYVGPKAQWP